MNPIETTGEIINSGSDTAVYVFVGIGVVVTMLLAKLVYNVLTKQLDDWNKNLESVPAMAETLKQVTSSLAKLESGQERLESQQKIQGAQLEQVIHQVFPNGGRDILKGGTLADGITGVGDRLTLIVDRLTAVEALGEEAKALGRVHAMIPLNVVQSALFVNGITLQNLFTSGFIQTFGIDGRGDSWMVIPDEREHRSFGYSGRFKTSLRPGGPDTFTENPFLWVRPVTEEEEQEAAGVEGRNGKVSRPCNVFAYILRRDEERLNEDTGRIEIVKDVAYMSVGAVWRV